MKLTWRSGRRWLVRLGLGAVALAILAASIASVIEKRAQSRDARRYLPPGRMVNVGTHSLHIHCLGTGVPIVVLEAGLQFWSSQWHWVHRRVAEGTRVCAYDRSGLVLVDPGIPTEFYEPGEDLEATCGWRCPAARLLASLGVFRRMYAGIMTNPEYPAAVLPQTRALLGTPAATCAWTSAMARIGRTAVQTMANDDLLAVPLVILRSQDFGLDEDVDEEIHRRRSARRERILTGMREILDLSSRSRGPIVVEGSNHESIIMYDRHATVVSEEIDEIVRSITLRKG